MSAEMTAQALDARYAGVRIPRWPGDSALAGEIDVSCADQLEQALQRIGLGACGGKVVIDAADLKFIDIRGLLTLDRHAAANEAILVLRSPPTVVTRLLTVVDVIAVRAEGRP